MVLTSLTPSAPLWATPNPALNLASPQNWCEELQCLLLVDTHQWLLDMNNSSSEITLAKPVRSYATLTSLMSLFEDYGCWITNILYQFVASLCESVSRIVSSLAACWRKTWCLWQQFFCGHGKPTTTTDTPEMAGLEAQPPPCDQKASSKDLQPGSDQEAILELC